MKNLIFMLFLVASLNVCGFSQVVVKTANFSGDCSSTISVENYQSVNYIYNSIDTTNNSRTITMVSSSLCNSSNTYTNIKFRKHFKAFDSITFNTTNYQLADSVLKLDKIYTNWQSTENIDVHVFEIKDIDTDSLLAIEYGSVNEYSTGKFYSYLMICDTNNIYASQYVGANLTYNLIFSSGGGFLYEITDDDRGNMFVGLKYKSPYKTEVYEKYLVPKP